MAADGLDDAAVARLLRSTRRIALLGASDKPHRPSFGVMQVLLDHGYDVTPVNPVLAGRAIRGRTVVGTLAEAAPLELVDVFRAPEHAPGIVEEAVRAGARAIWFQLGVVHNGAIAAARAAGLIVVADRCPAIEIPRLGLSAAPH